MSFEQREFDEIRQEWFYMKEYIQQRTFKRANGTVERIPYRNHKKVWCGNNQFPSKPGRKMTISDEARAEIIALFVEGKSRQQIVRETTHRNTLVMRVLEEFILTSDANDQTDQASDQASDQA